MSVENSVIWHVWNIRDFFLIRPAPIKYHLLTSTGFRCFMFLVGLIQYHDDVNKNFITVKCEQRELKQMKIEQPPTASIFFTFHFFVMRGGKKSYVQLHNWRVQSILPRNEMFNWRLNRLISEIKTTFFFFFGNDLET